MNEAIQVVGCIILDDYGRILLLHRTDSDLPRWETAGGKVEEDETLEVAAIREAAEEIGVPIEITGRLGKSAVELTTGVHEIHWMRAAIVSGEPQVMEHDKFDDLDYIEFEDLPSLSLSPGMLDFQEQVLSGELQL